MKAIVEKWNSISLVKRILCGLVIGAILGFVAKEATVIGLLGELFVGALKAVACTVQTVWAATLWPTLPSLAALPVQLPASTLHEHKAKKF